MAKKQTTTFRPNATTQLLAAVGVFALTVKMSRGSSLPVWERNLFSWIFNWPNFLHPFFIAVTQLGSIYMLFAITAIFLLKQKYHVMSKLLLSGTLAYLISGVAKDMFGRGRPVDFFPELSMREYIVRGPGFPSGHAALAAAIGFTLWQYLPKRHRWIAPFIIVSVGLSRIYLGVHTPLDVVGGIAIGWACAEIFRHVDIRNHRFVKRLQKRKQKRLKSA